MTDNDSICQSIALAEVVSFLEECRRDLDDNPVFKLSELSKMYATRLEQMGVNNSKMAVMFFLLLVKTWQLF